jgi:hypothetical protein
MKPVPPKPDPKIKGTVGYPGNRSEYLEYRKRMIAIYYAATVWTFQVRAQSLGLRKQRLKQEYKRNDKRRTHAHQGVLNRIIENQRRAGFLKG